MTFKTGLLATATALALGAAPVWAVSISVQEFDATSFGFIEGLGTFNGEDFENLGPGGGATVEGQVGFQGSPLSTAVGNFETVGGTGGGGTVTGSGFPNDGTGLALRDGTVFGRSNKIPTTGSWFLDSNDTHGIEWDVSLGGASFDAIFFTLTDGSDQGAFLRIDAGGGNTFEQRVGGKLPDGNSSIVVIEFSSAVTAADIDFFNFESDGVTFRKDDGFSLDGMRVGIGGPGFGAPPAPVPLPASGLLLIGALGAVALRARKARG
ncbi:hypothetical protein PVW48_15885 [Dinoroseobacter sp. PD6]|nr:hypothetical protein [Dinoroseobacter sp. PD6]